MKPGDMKARWIELIGRVTELCVSWTQGAPCKGYRDRHSGTATYALGTETNVAWDFTDARWPDVCEHCGIPVPKEEITRGEITLDRWIRTAKVFNTASGDPEKGDLYWATHDVGKCSYWDNCDGRHLHVILPDGSDWDCMWRASNCTLKEDKVHRCWVVHILPGDIAHVDKAGLTCGAGAGSFASTWHGFLHQGILEKC